MKKHWDLHRLYNTTTLVTWMNTLQHDLTTLHTQLHDLPAHDLQATLKNILIPLQHIIRDTDEIEDFLACLSETDDNSLLGQLLAQHATVMQQRSTLQTLFTHVLRQIPEQVWQRFIAEPVLAPLRFYLHEQRKQASDLLPPEQENIIHALAQDGFHSWEDHYDQMRCACHIHCDNETLSIDAALHKVDHTPDRAHRKHIADTMEQKFAEQADTFAFYLNRIAGFRLNVYQQRGWHLLKETCQQNRISETALQTMCTVTEQQQTLAHDFFKRKLALANVTNPSWYDLALPNFSNHVQLSYEQAADLIITQFHRFNERAGQLATRAFSDGWIETGTAGGGWGFCASLPKTKQSRIFLPFHGTYSDVIKLAHELGHAYHNDLLYEEPTFAQQKGVSVAEMASTFMENLVLDAVLEQTDNFEEKLALLEMKIGADLLYVTNIPNMFAFEQKFYEQRKAGPLAAEEICTLLADVQMPVYQGITANINCYEWMTVPHFYDTQKAFYNIPYTIGYFLSSGLYARAKTEGASFSTTYDSLLKHSGQMTIEQLSQTYLGADLHERDFWIAALAPLREAIDLYMALTEEMTSE